MEERRFLFLGSSGSSGASWNLRFLSYEKSISVPCLYYLDIQKIFSLQREDGRSRKNLQSVIDSLELPKDQPFHEALGRCLLYTPGSFRLWIKKKALEYFSVDYLPYSPEQEGRVSKSAMRHIRNLSPNLFRTKTEAMRDRKVAATCCYICGKPARKKIRWFTGNSKITTAWPAVRSMAGLREKTA